MNIDLLNKTMELEKECDRFLLAFNPDSLPRVVERGIKPILAGVSHLIEGSVLGFVDVVQVAVGKDKVIEGMVHVGVDQKANLVTVVVRMDGTMIRAPQAVAYEELIGLGITGVQLVEGVKKFATGVLSHQMSHTQGSA